MPSNSPTPSETTGCLYVVTTPIGNLQDITLRALQVLAQVALIAAEDTRHTRRLLEAHHIQGRLVSYHEHNEIARTPQLIERLRGGAQVALVTNAGTPLVSDPGYRLVCAALEQGVPVVPIPGVSAAVTALSVSGLPTDAFTFVGFPARAKAKRSRQLDELAALPHTLVFYQSPLRLLGFLDELMDHLGDRQGVLAREMTKLHEEFLRGPLSDIRDRMRGRPAVKGECTLLVAGAASPIASESPDWRAQLRAALQQAELPLSQVVKQIALQFGISRKIVYDYALRIKPADK